MSQELVISTNPIATTVAVIEDDRLVEVYIENHAQKAIVGSIYKGRVTRVLSGMQSAFVNLGLQRDAFLYVTDVLDPAEADEEALDEGLVAADPSRDLPTPGDPDDPEEQPESGQEERAEAQEDEAPDDSPEPPARRSRRRRRRGGRFAKDESAPAGAEPGDVAEAREGRAAEEPRAADAVVLPGESLAKYRGDGGPEPAAAAEPPPSASGDPEPDAAPDESPAEPHEDAAAPEDPDASGDAEAVAAEPQEAGAAPDGPLIPGMPDGEDDDGRPPRSSASVSAPSILAELNIFGWFRKKPEAESKPAEAPKEAPGRRRGGRRRPRSGQSRPAPGAATAGPKRSPTSPGRRPGRTRRPAEGRPRGSGRKPRAQRESGGRDEAPRREQQAGPDANIKDLLQNGQELIVQVNKEPVGTKGARITAHVTIPGRYMVYMTTAAHNGVAKKIQPESERKRLRQIVDQHSDGQPGGFVVRSVARGASEEDLVADMQALHKLWSTLQEKAEQRRAPAKLHSDLDIVERVMRDQVSQDYKSIWVDSEEEHERLQRFVERFNPDLADRVKLYTRQKPIFDSFGVSKELEKALKPKVWLKSGGYLVINQTEALVAIDVNTGRYVGTSNRLEDTVLQTNLEAAEEIVRQLRLRDLGGIIVIDFIDMEDRKNRQKVQQVLQEALRKTRSPSRLLPFNDFGLVVITRKAVRQSLERALCQPCPACSGKGTVKSSTTILAEVFEAAGRIAAGKAKKEGEEAKDLTLRVHPAIAKALKQKSVKHLDALEESVGAGVHIRSDSSMHTDEFRLG